MSPSPGVKLLNLWHRTVPKFETSAPALLARAQRVRRRGERSPNEVIVRFYRLE